MTVDRLSAGLPAFLPRVSGLLIEPAWVGPFQHHDANWPTLPEASSDAA